MMAMAKVLSVIGKVSFMLVGNVNAHPEECFGSYTTNQHGRAVRAFATSSGCEQMIT